MRPWSLPGTNRLRFALHGGQRKTTTNTAYIQGSGLFDNAGTLSVKDGTLYLYSQFSNTGLVDVQSGGLVLYGTGSHTGDFNALGSGGLYFRGNQPLLSGADVAGKVYAQSGTTTFTTGSTLAGTLTVNGSNAVMDVQSGAAVNPDTLDLAKGTFQTAGDVHVGQAFNWSNSYSKYSNNKSILGGAGRLLAAWP